MTCDAYEHLTRIAVEVKDLDLLPWVAEQLSWQYREQAVVANCTGPGVLPPGWRYPIVVQDGQVAFADFENAEGNQQGVEQFKARYTLDTAKKAAAAQGWLEERQAALESLTAIKRAGADIVVSYWTRDLATWL